VLFDRVRLIGLGLGLVGCALLLGHAAAQDGAELQDEIGPVAVLPVPEAPAAADENAPEEVLCAAIEAAAKEYDVPVGFFTRLLWTESRFRSEAVSPKGAQGIAQFMPYTAAERGLLDPFDPLAAIPASAHLLADLKAAFGNLGLAAAAYNAGRQRVTDWLAANSTLPWETQDYVLSITGVPAETWAAPTEADHPRALHEQKPETCLQLAALLKVPGNAVGPDIETAHGPWGVQVAGNFSRARAISAYTALQKRYPALLAEKPPMILAARLRGRGTRALHQVRVPMQSRDEAESFCAKLRSAGASCVVLKTP
jgi:hypothetical protein